MSEGGASSPDSSSQSNYSKELGELSRDKFFREYMKPQQMLQYYLTLRAFHLGLITDPGDSEGRKQIASTFLGYKIAPGENGEEDVGLGLLYSQWFDQLMRDNPTMTLGDFVAEYGPENFPQSAERLFRKILPDETVDEFLRKCLNVANTTTSAVDESGFVAKVTEAKAIKVVEAPDNSNTAAA